MVAVEHKSKKQYYIYRVTTFATIPPSSMVILNSFHGLRQKIGTLRALVSCFVLRFNFAAIALNPFVISKTELWTSLWKHELVHIAQQRKDGWCFWIKYCCAFLRNCIRYFNFDHAYRSIPYEREAYELQLERNKDRFRVFLNQNGIEVIE